MFARPFWIALVLTVPVLLYAEPIEHLLGYTAPRFPGSGWLVPILASVIYWYCGWVFLTGAVSELRSRQPGMMTLVALAITTAYFYSLAVTFGLVLGMPFYWELATLVTIMLLGHWMEMRARRQRPERAERAGQTAAGHGRAPRAMADRDGAGRRAARGRPGAGPARRSRSRPTAWSRRAQLRSTRAMLTGESRPVDKAAGRRGDRRHGQRQRQPARAGDGDRRPDGAGRHHAAGQRGADEQVAHPGAGRPRGVLADAGRRSASRCSRWSAGRWRAGFDATRSSGS